VVSVLQLRPLWGWEAVSMPGKVVLINQRKEIICLVLPLEADSVCACYYLVKYLG
jgi:hypothetical protein